MKAVVGLGNPGEKYAKNRHNAGFMVVGELYESMGRDGASLTGWESRFNSLLAKAGEVVLLKPQTFMNQSGGAVGQMLSFYKIESSDLIVIHDDLDIRLGEYKIVKGVGPKIHNGLNSIEKSLGSIDFHRVRLGVDNRGDGVARTPGDTYVLSDFLPEEKIIFDKVIKEAVRAIISFLNED